MNRADDLAELRRALLDHYDRYRRALPWRDESDPYRVLVSEVMLQQTRVETVTRYYGPWLERFPDLVSLAAAEEADVLKAWEGLGYYRRARSLHGAARAVRERPDRALPSTYEELRELPGLGDYTAGAVASIAFGERVPAADGNVRRVLARLFDVEDPRPRWVRDTAAELVDPARPGDWNQALMELGATVCALRAPRCGACPVGRWCAARAAGTVHARPGGPARREPRRVRLALLVLLREGRVLLERRPRGGLLGGLWAFPEEEIDGPDDAPSAARRIAARLGASARGAPRALSPFEHRFTHLHATYVPCVLEVAAADAVAGDAGEEAGDAADSTMGEGAQGRSIAWVALAAPTPLALPVAQRRLLERLATDGRGASAEGSGVSVEGSGVTPRASASVEAEARP